MTPEQIAKLNRAANARLQVGVNILEAIATPEKEIRIRIFFPSRKYVGNTTLPVSVERWTWTEGKGLFVTYKHGFGTVKSDYTLPEFLMAIADGREFAVEQ